MNNQVNKGSKILRMVLVNQILFKILSAVLKNYCLRKEVENPKVGI